MTLVKKIKDKKVNFEFNKEFIKVVTDKISSNDAEFITNSFNDMHPADAADIIEHLSENDREKLIKLNNFKVDPEVFVELNESIQSELIAYLSSDSIVNILKNLESDDAIKILENVDEKDKNSILGSLPPKDRFALLESLSYPEDSAARIMQREFTAIPSNWSVGQTIDYLRENKDFPEEFLEIFIVDENFKPYCLDREVEKFQLMDWKKVLKLMQNTNSIKNNCNVVFFNFMVRHGLINNKLEKNYEKILRL